ncbi:EpsG family protein [Aestuariibaculum sp. M13]|uniref:EpsG family protein n=1 Tax=Aestuariibaculum sp. M13 TaxID=2967132 RepID=UPI002159DF69|nr:EpsG family protein [Aestuariibaculum sp. M13]MCR8667202.1 EpsG family protein [Aestuariibaculum sp. M13]
MNILKYKKIQLESLFSIPLLICFIINPLFGVLLFGIYIIGSDRSLNLIVKLSPYLIALFIGCVNATKVPENDLVWYLSEYLRAGNMSFSEYIASFGTFNNTVGILASGKEAAFAVFNYISYQFFGDNTKLYVLFYSFVAYSFLNVSIYKFGKALKIPNKYIITSIFIMAFTPYIFTMSAILLRQFLAAAILMYVLVNRLLYEKKSYVLLIVMFMVHSSAFLFVPFIFVPFFNKSLLHKNTFLYYLIILIVLFNIQNIAKVLLPIFENISTIKYILTRASEDTTFDLGQLSLAKRITSILTAVLPLILIYILKPRLKKETGIIHFFNVLLMLVIFIFANLHQSELSNRFNFYVWQFFPFVFLLYIWYFKLNRLILLLLMIFIVLFFIYYLSAGMWTYTVGFGVYYYSLIHYFII